MFYNIEKSILQILYLNNKILKEKLLIYKKINYIKKTNNIKN